MRFLYAALNETISTDDKVLQDVFLRIRGARTFTLVGIYPSIPPFLTIKDFRDMLISEVKTQLSEDQLKWFTHNLNRTIFWHVIDLEEFLTFMTIPKIKRHFAYELRRYILEMKFDEYIFVERKPPLNFRSYLLYRHPVSNGNPRFRQSGMLPELAISFNEGFQIIKDILGWKENAGSETLT